MSTDRRHMTSRLVVVGGGFAGFWAAVAARRVSEEAAITLVSAQSQLVIRPRLYEANPNALGVELQSLLDLVDVDLIVDTCTSIDTARSTLSTPRLASLPFDALVLATGSTLNVPPIPGASSAHSIDTITDAVAFDESIRAHVNRDVVTVVIVGAGFTGIELALEIADRFAAHGRDERQPAPRVVLVDRNDVVGNDLGPGPRPAIEAALGAAGVETRLGVGISNITQRQVLFADGSAIDADIVVLCTGLRASPLAATLAATLGAPLDGLGRVVVDRTLAIANPPGVFVGVFVAGDVASVDTGDGHRSLMSCQHALMLGRVAGENAARFLRGDALVDYEQSRYVTCLDLGRSGAVLTSGWERAEVSRGAAAKDIKRRINTEVIYPDPSKGRVGLLQQSRLDPSQR